MAKNQPDQPNRSLDKLSVYDSEDVIVVIETPKGSPNKYTYEPRFGAFVLKGVLPAGAVFRSTSASCRRRAKTAIRWTSLI